MDIKSEIPTIPVRFDDWDFELNSGNVREITLRSDKADTLVETDTHYVFRMGTGEESKIAKASIAWESHRVRTQHLPDPNYKPPVVDEPAPVETPDV